MVVKWGTLSQDSAFSGEDDNAKVPYLLLKGNWLSKAGFTFHKKVKVIVNES